jgi:hypothetical protein
MNLLKTLAWKVKLLLMIAINMLKLLKVLFLISMLIFVEHLELVKRIISKKIIVSTTGVKKLECYFIELDEMEFADQFPAQFDTRNPMAMSTHQSSICSAPLPDKIFPSSE